MDQITHAAARPALDQGPTLGPPPALPPRRIKPPCAVHQEVESVWSCERCLKAMCKVCEFQFPGRVRLCAACVSAPQPGVAPFRIGQAIGGVILTVVSLACFAGISAGSIGQANVGQAFTWMVCLPALAGFSLSIAAIDRRLGNNALLWISFALSTLLVVVLLVLIVVGNLKH